MKYLKYVGLYFAMVSVGYNVLKMTEADKVWIVLFFGGVVLWYVASMWEKDS